MPNSNESTLKTKIKDLVLKSTLFRGVVLNYPTGSENEISTIYVISTELNSNLTKYIKDQTVLGTIISDIIFNKGTITDVDTSINFSLSPLNQEIDTITSEIVEVIKSIPVEYTFTFPLNIFDKRFDGVDIELNGGFHLKGLNIDQTKTWSLLLQYSGYGANLSQPESGTNLSLTGSFQGYVMKNFKIQLSEVQTLNDVKEILCLLIFSGVLNYNPKPFQKLDKLQINYYENDLYVTNSFIDNQFSYWLQRLKVSDDAFKSKTGGIYKLLTGNDEPPKADLDNFKEKIADINEYLEIKSSAVKNSSLFKKYSNSLSWYLEAITSENLNVRLVNFCIIIETLLGSENREAWKRIELPERVSYLIGEYAEERDRLKSYIDVALQKRNNIVHQGEVLESGSEQIVENLNSTVFIVMRHELEVLKKTFKKLNT